MHFMNFLASAIDTSIVSELIELCKTVMGLFTEFPINIFLYAGLVGIAFKIFKQGKGAAKSN